MNEYPYTIIEINGNFYFDTEYLTEEDFRDKNTQIVYQMKTDKDTFINIMDMFQNSNATDEDKYAWAIEMLTGIDVVKDKYEYERFINFAKKIAIFLNCGDEDNDIQLAITKKDENKERIWDWRRDKKLYCGAINYSYNNILIENPDLHCWHFVSCFQQLKEESKFNDVYTYRRKKRDGKLSQKNDKDLIQRAKDDSKTYEMFYKKGQRANKPKVERPDYF